MSTVATKNEAIQAQGLDLTLSPRSLAAEAAPELDVRFWRPFGSPPPRGFWSVVKHNPQIGEVLIQLGTLPHAPDAPLTIGYLFAGYETDNPGYPMRGFAYPTSISLRANGGVVVPWGYAENKAGRKVVYDNERLQQGQLARFYVKSIGPGRFRVGVYLRAVFSGSAMPYGEIIARVGGWREFGSLAAESVEATEVTAEDEERRQDIEVLASISDSALVGEMSPTDSGLRELLGGDD